MGKGFRDGAGGLGTGESWRSDTGEESRLTHVLDVRDHC